MTDQQKDDDAWLGKVRSALDQSTRDLDAATLSRLNRARQAALLAVGRPATNRAWWLPSLAAAMSLVLALGLWLRPQQAIEPNSSSAEVDFVMLSEPDQIALYDDLEFYAWLDQQDASDASWSAWSSADQDS